MYCDPKHFSLFYNIILQDIFTFTVCEASPIHIFIQLHPLSNLTRYLPFITFVRYDFGKQNALNVLLSVKSYIQYSLCHTRII